MRKESFPIIALTIGLLLQLLLMKFGERGSAGFELPLLTLLLISEFGLFVTGIGAYMGAHSMFKSGFKTLNAIVTICCGILAVRFLLLGLAYWPK